MSRINETGQTVLEGDGSFNFEAIVDGNDLVVHRARATAWGGPSDPWDKGRTAAGVDTATHGDTVLGCSLPQSGAGVSACNGSPIPKLRYGRVDADGKPIPDTGWVRVRVFSRKTGQQAECIVIDIGPAKPPRANAAIDLTTGTIRALGFAVDPNDFEDIVDFRVFDGATFLP